MEKISTILRHMIFPQSCPVCGKLAVAYCDKCLESAVENFSPFCSECGGRWETSACIGAFPCYFASLYESHARDFLIYLKYKNSRLLGYPMGRLMGKLFPKLGADFIVPIPLHLGSSRVYNQTRLMADGVSELHGIPVLEALSWRLELDRQVEKRARERQSLPINSISCTPLTDKKILLLDDVYTTGSTLRAAKEAIKDASGKVIGAYFWSRTARKGDEDEWADVSDALTLEIK